MVTPDEFRAFALALEGAVESEHNRHPDFRVGNRVFATLGYPDDGYAMVKLTPEEQLIVSQAYPKQFEPVAGGWGRSGSTLVVLKRATKAATKEALRMAWDAKRPQAKNARGRRRP